MNAESTLRFLASNSGNAELAVTAPEGGDAEFHLNADENDDMHDRYKLVSGADNHFQMYQMSSGGGWESRVKFHSARGNIEPIHDTIGLHVVVLWLLNVILVLEIQVILLTLK